MPYSFSYSLFPSLLPPHRQKSTVFTEQMCVLLIATSVGSYFTWILFLLVCFLSSWPQPVPISLPFRASCLCMLALGKIHIRVFSNGLGTRHWAGRYVVIVFPETSYTCTLPMTSLDIPLKMKLPILSICCHEGLLTWRMQQAFSFLLDGTLYLFCPDGFAAGLICWTHAGTDVAVQALILCALSKHCGQLWSCFLPQVALQGMQAHFYLSVFCSAQLDPFGSPCGSEKCWKTGGSPVDLPCLIPVSHLAIDLTFWPSFLVSAFYYDKHFLTHVTQSSMSAAQCARLVLPPFL